MICDYFKKKDVQPIFAASFRKIYNVTKSRYLFTNALPVRTVLGATPPIISVNDLNAYSNDSVVSSVNKTAAKIMLWKWLLTPTNNPNGRLYRLVRYIVSKVTTSQKICSYCD